MDLFLIMNRQYVLPKLRRLRGVRYPGAAVFSNSDAGISDEVLLDTEDPRVKARPVDLKSAEDWARRLSPELVSG